MKRIISVVLGFTLMAIAAWAIPGNQSAEESNQARVARNKWTILQRMEREEVTFRGKKEGEKRIQWEWVDDVVNRYLFEKRVLLIEKSVQEKYALRSRWVLKNMKVTFQELFDLGSENDDKLLPILSHRELLFMVPAATFEGLTLRGKKGEVKGIVKRKFRRWENEVEATVRFIGYIDRLEYEDEKGKLRVAKSKFSWDAFTFRWGDIKDLVADDMSQAKAIEDLRLDRDARAPEPE